MNRLARACALAIAVGGLLAAPASAAQLYVALGDSYSSGTGTRTYFDSGCQRSVYAYPYIVGTERPNTSLVFAACSGAKTGDVLANQVSSLTSATAFVTITIGGNDAGFSNVISSCARPWPWTCWGDIDNAQNYIRNTLPGKLDSVYSQIRSRSPSATVVVLSYPRLFNGRECNAGSRISSGEQARLNDTADLLRDVTRGRAQAAAFTFRDAIPPFLGHAVCDSVEWLNGLSNPVGESYHPNRTGHRSGYVPLVRGVIG
jgi:lysophospholipase L1-like esterase